MSITSRIMIEIKKNERTYGFSIPVGAPFGEAYDAAFEILQEVVEMAKQAVDSTRPSAEQSEQPVESSEEVN